MNYDMIEAFKELNGIPLATATSGSLAVNIEVSESEAETDNPLLDNITDLIGVGEQDIAVVGETSDEEED